MFLSLFLVVLYPVLPLLSHLHKIMRLLWSIPLQEVTIDLTLEGSSRWSIGQWPLISLVTLGSRADGCQYSRYLVTVNILFYGIIFLLVILSFDKLWDNILMPLHWAKSLCEVSELGHFTATPCDTKTCEASSTMLLDLNMYMTLCFVG